MSGKISDRLGAFGVVRVLMIFVNESIGLFFLVTLVMKKWENA